MDVKDVDQAVEVEESVLRYGCGSDKNRQLSINSAYVSNSSDVHFGDRTYYNGPVIIKQYILVDDDEYLENELGNGMEASITEINEVENDEKQETKLLENNLKEVDYCGYKVTGDFATIDTINEDRQIVFKDFTVPSIDNAKVTVIDSKDIHFGSQIHYKGPVTVERLLYPKSKIDFHALESKLWLNNDTDAFAKVLTIISRIEWQAKPPIEEPEDLIHPEPYIIINHTATANCSTRIECIRYIRIFQRYHIEERKWFDIGYNFLIGADGNVYDGRGWNKIGAHTKNYNHVSIGVGFIGTFCDVKAPKQQVAAFTRLIKEGVRKGYILRKYKIFAARQLGTTVSPGKALYEQMKSWPRWCESLQITEL